MEKPPDAPPPEDPVDELDELDDDAIVAAQSAAHAPKPRQAVKMENESVVIADEPAPQEPQRKTVPPGLSPYRRGDPTIVLKRPSGLEPSKRAGKKTWTPWLIWGGAGVVAFGFGGILAAMTAGSDSGKGQGIEVNAPGTTAPPPSAVEAPEPVATPAATTAGADADAAVLSPTELPVEAKKKPSRRPAARVAPKATPTRPPESDIPSGI